VHSFKAKDTKQQIKLGNNKLQKIQPCKVDSDAEENDEMAEQGDVQEIDETGGEKEADFDETEFGGKGSDQEELSEDDGSHKVYLEIVLI